MSRTDIIAVNKVLKSRWLSVGPVTEEFEKTFAAYIGVKHAVAVANCTSALFLALRAMGIGEGDEVIVPVFTFVATSNAVIHAGARPVFADVSEDSYNINPMQLLERITDKTRAIALVHFAGQPCDMKEIVEIASDRKIAIIEDCAHAVGAEYDSRKVGSYGKCGCFSFYPTKPITSGEGGMLVTEDPEIARRVRLLRNHCATKTVYERTSQAKWGYDILDVGYNLRMSEIEAALGLSQLKRLNKTNGRRVSKARYLTEKLRKVNGITPPIESPNRSHIYHLYPARVDAERYGIGRDELINKLNEDSIETTVHYRPIHLFSSYRELFGTKEGDFPVAESIFSKTISLPMFNNITRSQLNYVVDRIQFHSR